jgi:N-acetylneuraminic acid mutarotase
LAGVAGNCLVEGENPRAVTVSAGGTTTADFVVTCQIPTASTGTIHISTTTSGGGIDPDGYQFQIDGSGTQPIASSGEATVGNVSVGAHSVLLVGVAGQCAAATNPQNITVTAGGTVAVAFSVTCETAPTGSIEVRTTTTGSGLDPDGYTFTVASGAPQPIGANATVSSGSLAPGNYSVQLAGVAGNCTLEGTNPRAVTVTANNTTQVAFAITCAAVANTWQTKAPMPEPLWAHAAGVIPASNGDQIIYVVGGYTGNAAIRVPNVYAYNTRTDTWTKSASLPFGRAETNGAVPIGGKLYVSGGIGDGVGILNDLSVYTPSTNTWVQKHPMPNRVYQGSSAAMEGKLYVLHGFCDDCATVVSQQLWRYDPATDRWTRMRDAPRPHVSAASGVINGKWYVAGGGNGGQKVDMYDPETNTWTEKATMPAGHWGGAGAVLGQKLYVIGGYDPSTLQYLNTVHAYDPATNTWSTRASMPTARSNLVAVKAVRNGNSVLYALGGGGPQTAVNEEYDD